MEEYLMTYHENDIFAIVRASQIHDIPFKVLEIDMGKLKDQNLSLFNKLTFRLNVWEERPKWIEALNRVQEQLINSKEDDVKKFYQLKEDFPVTFVNLPTIPGGFLPYLHLWSFAKVTGSVIRTRERGLREIVQEYKCRKCKYSQLIHADRLTSFHFDIPTKCKINECKGTVYNVKDPSGDENLNYFIDFQEIMIQPFEQHELLTVEFERELVETCFVGDIVTICGTFETRSKKNEADSHRLMMRALSVTVHQNQQKMHMDPDEMQFIVQENWQSNLEQYGEDELVLRDQMIVATAPALEGLTIVKLGLLLVLCSGGSSSIDGTTQARTASTTTREIAHFMLIGDPGMGKSQLLKAASEISTNSVRTVGYAATTAGLTAHCFQEDGVSQVEAGALVKANNGICCIDEINLMTKEHRGAIHEVMEAQKITIAKAGIRTELPTKCSIIAGMNQRNSNLPLDDKNFGLEGSLRSRFDLIFELLDPKDPELDMRIIQHVLNEASTDVMQTNWPLERLQMHIMVAKSIRVEMSEEASTILSRYYQFCTRQEDIDVSRTTMRMWTSLERLTICHAKLMLRSKTKIIDALTVIMIMESSWSFGLFMSPLNVMQSFPSLGPPQEYIQTVLHKLNLSDLSDDEKPKLLNPQVPQPAQEFTLDDIDRIFADDSDEEDLVDDNSVGLKNMFTQDPATIQLQGSHPFTQSSIQLHPVKSFESDDFPKNEIDFHSPPTTSTQKTPEKADKRSMDFNDELPAQPKKQKLQPIITDPLMANLNSLAAMFAGSKEKEKPADPSPPTSSGVLRIFDKLNKYKYKDDPKCSETLENTVDKTLVAEGQNQQKRPIEEETELNIDDDDFDPWGDVEFS